MKHSKVITIRPWAFWTIVCTGMAVFGFVAFLAFRDDLAAVNPWLYTAGRISGGLWVMSSFIVMCIQDFPRVTKRKAPNQPLQLTSDDRD